MSLRGIPRNSGGSMRQSTSVRPSLVRLLVAAVSLVGVGKTCSWKRVSAGDGPPKGKHRLRSDSGWVQASFTTRPLVIWSTYWIQLQPASHWFQAYGEGSCLSKAWHFALCRWQNWGRPANLLFCLAVRYFSGAQISCSNMLCVLLKVVFLVSKFLLRSLLLVVSHFIVS